MAVRAMRCKGKILKVTDTLKEGAGEQERGSKKERGAPTRGEALWRCACQ